MLGLLLRTGAVAGHPHLRPRHFHHVGHDCRDQLAELVGQIARTGTRFCHGVREAAVVVDRSHGKLLTEPKQPRPPPPRPFWPSTWASTRAWAAATTSRQPSCASPQSTPRVGVARKVAHAPAEASWHSLSYAWV